jgi:hypothetical protein
MKLGGIERPPPPSPIEPLLANATGTVSNMFDALGVNGPIPCLNPWRCGLRFVVPAITENGLTVVRGA